MQDVLLRKSSCTREAELHWTVVLMNEHGRLAMVEIVDVDDGSTDNPYKPAHVRSAGGSSSPHDP